MRNKKIKHTSPDVQKMRSFLQAMDHITAFEERLADFLEWQCRESNITVADVKDIIWNEQNSNLGSRMAFEIAEQNPKTKFENVLQIMNDAWNHFPHKRLNGLAPRDMVERINEDANFTPEARPDFYTIFADRFPGIIQLKKQSGSEWSWEFPAAYHTELTELAAIRNKQKEASLYEERGSFNTEDIAQEMFHSIEITFARTSLEKEPLQFEAANILARHMFDAGEMEHAIHMCETTLNRGKKMFPPEFSLGMDHLPWGFVDNRPYLFLFGEYATLVNATAGPQKAIPFYEELLDLNPNDNQGIRSLLSTAYIKTGRLNQLLELDKKYPDDLMVELKVGTLLALYKLGRLDEARIRALQMKKHFSHIFCEILKTSHPQPELIPGRVRVGGDDEAWLYWEEQGTFWMAAPGSREFLRECIGTTAHTR